MYEGWRCNRYRKDSYAALKVLWETGHSDDQRGVDLIAKRMPGFRTEECGEASKRAAAMDREAGELADAWVGNGQGPGPTVSGLEASHPGFSWVEIRELAKCRRRSLRCRSGEGAPGRRGDRHGLCVRFKKEVTGNPLWVAGYSTDVFGYVPSPACRRKAVYEPVGSTTFSILPGPLATSTEDRIMSKVTELVDRVRKR